MYVSVAQSGFVGTKEPPRPACMYSQVMRWVLEDVVLLVEHHAHLVSIHRWNEQVSISLEHHAHFSGFNLFDTTIYTLLLLSHTHSLGFLSTSNRRSSLEPFSGECIYCHRAVSGKLMRMLSTRAPGVLSPNDVPRSWTRLNST
jgi:hypothetical protein